MPKGTVQLIYATSRSTGYKLVSDQRIGATGFTGSRPAGLALKKAADEAGKPIYLELSSVNPVVVLKGALAERGDAIADEFTMSCLASTGQLCTKPGLLIVPDDSQSEAFIATVADKFNNGPVGALLNGGSAGHIANTVATLVAAGASQVTSADKGSEARFCHANTLLSVSGKDFLADPEKFQEEMFGNASLVIRSSDTDPNPSHCQRP